MFYASHNCICVVGGEPLSSASAQEKPSDGQPGENEPAALPGGQQILPPRLQEHRRLVTETPLVHCYLSATRHIVLPSF